MPAAASPSAAVSGDSELDRGGISAVSFSGQADQNNATSTVRTPTVNRLVSNRFEASSSLRTGMRFPLGHSHRTLNTLTGELLLGIRGWAWWTGPTRPRRRANNRAVSRECELQSAQIELRVIPSMVSEQSSWPEGRASEQRRQSRKPVIFAGFVQRERHWVPAFVGTTRS